MAFLDRPRLLFTHINANTRYCVFDIFLGDDNIDFQESDYELDTEVFLKNQHFDLIIIDESHSEEKIYEYLAIAKQRNIKTILLFGYDPDPNTKNKYEKEGINLTISMATLTLQMHSDNSFSIKDLIYNLIGKKTADIQKPSSPIPAPREYLIVVGDPLSQIDPALYNLFPDTFTFVFSDSNADCKRKLQSYKVDLFLVYYKAPNPVATTDDPKRIQLADTTNVLDHQSKKCLAIYDESTNLYTFGDILSPVSFGADRELPHTSSIHDIQKCIYEMINYKNPSGF